VQIPHTPSAPPGAPRSVEEMAANKPTLPPPCTRPSRRFGQHGDMTGRQRRRADRRHHLLHQHLEPERAARRGLLAKKAVEAGLKVKPHIKTSLAPGSRIVTEYLTKAGLAALPREARLQRRCLRLHHLYRQRRRPDAGAERGDHQERPDLRRGASGNRNFEARIHPNLKANFLASPPLVVAYAIAGTVLKDLMTEPVGKGKGGKDVTSATSGRPATRSPP
jgi:aconitate hydratase